MKFVVHWEPNPHKFIVSSITEYLLEEYFGSATASTVKFCNQKLINLLHVPDIPGANKLSISNNRLFQTKHDSFNQLANTLMSAESGVNMRVSRVSPVTSSLRNSSLAVPSPLTWSQMIVLHGVSLNLKLLRSGRKLSLQLSKLRLPSFFSFLKSCQVLAYTSAVLVLNQDLSSPLIRFASYKSLPHKVTFSDSDLRLRLMNFFTKSGITGPKLHHILQSTSNFIPVHLLIH